MSRTANVNPLLVLELLFCAHHNRQYASALTKIAVEIRDETGQLGRVAA